MIRLALVALLFAGTGTAPTPRIEHGTDPTQVRVIVKFPADAAKGLPQGKLAQEQGEAWLRLCLLDAKGKDGVAMLGAYQRRQDELTFTPRFPLQHDHRYRARFGPADGPSADYRVPPRPPSPAPTVVKVYPSGDVLPANHLRFRIHFSAPMRGGKEIFEQIRLLDDKGEVIGDPWLYDELWADDGRTLILYIHPGRIKYGLLLRLLLGPVLLPNRDYTLEFGADLTDAKGQRLGKAFRKKFRTTVEDRSRIELSRWKVQAPSAGTRGPLVLSFPNILDRFCAERMVKVVDGGGKEVAGKVELSAAERSWIFRPAQPWKAAAYRIVVDGELEDDAGNTPLRPFDLDLTTKQPPPQRLGLPFEPRPAPASSAAP